MDVFRMRLRFIATLLVIAGGVIVFRLVSLQFGRERPYFEELADTVSGVQIYVEAPRGRIFDRDGQLLATNAVHYELGITPRFVTDPEAVATVLSDELDRSVSDIRALLVEKSDEDGDPIPYVLVAR
ncbi:MAG: hypothetical protein ACE5FI_15715, partial [Anaerolineales bacterium]